MKSFFLLVSILIVVPPSLLYAKSGIKVFHDEFIDNSVEKRRNFDLYSINVNGSGLERSTFLDGFDGSLTSSPSGKYLVSVSNRNQKKRGDTNTFLAERNYQ